MLSEDVKQRNIFGIDEIVRIKLPQFCSECTFADVEIVMARHETCCCCLRSGARETAANYIKQQSAKTHECGSRSIMQTLLKNTPFQTCSAMEISNSAKVCKVVIAFKLCDGCLVITF